ncbi:MAG TPA: ribonuclease E/G [Stellaceae bacterium]|nr:ribonuclease E/G [Stellaceae bacterium]
MTRELIISVGPGECRGGLFEDGEAVELAVERDDRPSQVGAIYMGRVQRVTPALAGAFVDIGTERPAFLAKGKGLAEGARIVVQVVKDAFDDKGPEVRAAIELQGRHAVWTPHRPGLAVSRRLSPARRARISEVLAPFVQENEGVVIRSESGDAAIDSLREDIVRLRGEYGEIERAMRSDGRPRRLDRLRGPLEALLSVYGPAGGRLLIDDRAAVAQARQIADGWPAEYTSPDEEPIMRLEEAFSGALANTVALPGGARLRMEPGPAFTSIDVDLGGMAGGRQPAAEAIRRVNLAAAETLARELRRRGVGGAVVVDFVSMTRRGDRQDVETALATGVAADPAGVQLHGWTRLGHFELTRRRVRPSLADMLLEQAGDRRAKSALTIGLEVLRGFARHAYAPAGLAVSLHPSVAAALAGPLSHHVDAAESRTGQRLTLLPDAAHSLESFEIQARSR